MSLTSIVAIFAVFAGIGMLSFRWLPPRTAVRWIFFGGWLLLPVGHYPDGAVVDGGLPYWIVGTALPSDMLLTKAWVAPCTALVGALLFDRPTWRCWRPTAADLPIALWCVWPWWQGAFVVAPVPGGGLASLYLLGSWGATWLLGRTYFGSIPGQLALLRGLVGFGLASLPISLIEGVAGPVLYAAVFGLHPFRDADVERYAGYRPIGFLENGNQYGLWICIAALAAVWLVLALRPNRASRGWRVAAAVAVPAMALAAQSAGAIILTATGIGFLATCGVLRPRNLVIVLLVALVGGGSLYLSGRLPVESLRRTPAGEAFVDSLKNVGRGSLVWRIAQDQRLLADAKRAGPTGSGAWDWWRPRGTRPWGLPVLLLGQYGVIGLALAFAAWLGPVVSVLWRSPRQHPWRSDARTLLIATLVLIAAADALLNSFIFFPALAFAGSLVPERDRRP